MTNITIVKTQPNTEVVTIPPVRYYNSTKPIFLADTAPSVQRIQGIMPLVPNRPVVPYKTISNLPFTNPNVVTNSTQVIISQNNDIVTSRRRNDNTVSYKIINNMYDSLYNTSNNCSIRFKKTIVTNVIKT